MSAGLFTIFIVFAFAMTIRRAYQLGRHNERRRYFTAILRPDDSAKQRL